MADENKKANYAGIELWKLSVPELEKLLYSGSHLPDDGADEDFYDAVEKVLLRKEQENPSGRLPDPSKAWVDFQTEYAHFPAASVRDKFWRCPKCGKMLPKGGKVRCQSCGWEML